MRARRVSLARGLAALLALGLTACSGGGGKSGPAPELSVLPLACSVERNGTIDIVPTITNVAKPNFQVTLSPPAALAGASATTLASQFGQLVPHEVTQAGGGTVTVQKFVAGDSATLGLVGQVNVSELTSGLRATIPVMIVGFVKNVTVQPSPVAVPVGQTQTFTASAFDIDSQPVADTLPDWRVTGGIGTIGKDGVFHATTPGTGTVTVSIGSADLAVAQVTVVGAVTGLNVLPFGDPLQIEAGTGRTFSAVLRDAGGNQQPVTATWTASGTAGTVTSAGLFTASATVGATGTLTATAQGKSASVHLQVIAQLTPPSGPRNVSGQVTLPGGQPAVGATVQALNSGDNSVADQATTGADGSYALLLAAGSYTLKATLAGQGPAQQALTLASGDQRVRADLVLTAAAPGR